MQNKAVEATSLRSVPNLNVRQNMKIITLVKIASLGVILSLPVVTSAAEIVLRDSSFTLTKNWQLSEGKLKASGLAAIWVNPATQLPNAAIIAKPLTRTVAAEADEMAASADKQPQFVTLIEDRTIKLNDQSQARIVCLEIKSKNEDLGIEAPMVFYSIYMPTKDGLSVTLKLLCAKTRLADLKGDFETIAFGNRQQQGQVEQATDGKTPEATQPLK